MWVLQNTHKGTELIFLEMAIFAIFFLHHAGCPADDCGSELRGCTCNGCAGACVLFCTPPGMAGCRTDIAFPSLGYSETPRNMRMWFCCVTSVRVSFQQLCGRAGPQRDCSKYVADVQPVLMMKAWEMLDSKCPAAFSRLRTKY